MASVVAETIDLVARKSPPALQEAKIKDLAIGVFFTGVKLSTGHSGVVFTPIGEIIGQGSFSGIFPVSLSRLLLFEFSSFVDPAAGFLPRGTDFLPQK